MARRSSHQPRISIKSEAEIALMRKAGKIVALALARVGDNIRPGITTGELDTIAEQTIRGLGGIPAFLNYNGFPATACISINDEVVHGIPGTRQLHEGDIVGVDLGAIYEGWYGDSAYTYPVGQVSAQATRLMDIGKEALVRAIAAAKSGNHVRDIGAAVEQLARETGVSVVKDLCGHGIGMRLHEEPQVPNYQSRGANHELKPGMTLAIEPMLNAGGDRVILMDDDWTFVTADNSLSIHYEHTVLITDDGAEILTLRC